MWKSFSLPEAASQVDAFSLKMLSFMMFCHVWILHTVLILCRANSTAVIRYSVPEDHHVCLRCGNDSDVVWTHETRNVPVTRKGIYETNDDPERCILLSDGSLLLLKLDKSDGGEYRCNSRLVAELQVLTGHDFSVSAGRTLLLPCSRSSRPKQRWFYRRREERRRELIFTWFGNGTAKPEKEGSRLSYGNDGLQIQNLQLEDTGEYLCNGNLQARLTVVTVRPVPTSKAATPVTITAETKKKEKSRTENVLLMVGVVGLGLMILLMAAVCILLTSSRCRKEKKYRSTAASQRHEDTKLQPWKTSNTQSESAVPECQPHMDETIHYASLGRQNWRGRPCRTPPDQNLNNIIYSSVVTKPTAR